jgi:hypothetical protein
MNHFSNRKNRRPTETPPRPNKRGNQSSSPARGAFAPSIFSTASSWFFTSSHATQQPSPRIDELPSANNSLQHPPNLFIPEQPPSLFIPEQSPAGVAAGADVEAVTVETVTEQQSSEREPASQESGILRTPEMIVEERNKKCSGWNFGSMPMQCYPTETALIDACDSFSSQR